MQSTWHGCVRICSCMCTSAIDGLALLVAMHLVSGRTCGAWQGLAVVLSCPCNRCLCGHHQQCCACRPTHCQSACGVVCALMMSIIASSLMRIDHVNHCVLWMVPAVCAPATSAAATIHSKPCLWSAPRRNRRAAFGPHCSSPLPQVRPRACVCCRAA